MSFADSKEPHQALVVNTRSREKDLLEKMRKKLAAQPATKETEPVAILSPRAVRLRRERLSKTLWVAGVAAVALGLNIYALIHKNQILERMGIRQERVLGHPATDWSLDDQALFWAYAAYDGPVFRQRYSVGDALIDPDDARHHLKILLPKTSASVHAQIVKMQMNGKMNEKR